MKILAVIPARWASTRLPGKPLAMLAEKPLIQHVYQRVFAAGVFNEVIVATDDERIKAAVEVFGAKAEMTAKDHKSGTDRVWEVCSRHNFEVVVNIQGDEPFIDKKILRDLAELMQNENIPAASLMHKISANEDDPNRVKVVIDKNFNALYFSRAKIPFNRDNDNKVEYWGHIGVYAFRREILKKFVNLPVSKLEKIEKLEQLRLLENGIKIRMLPVEYNGLGIDTPEDLAKAQRILMDLPNN